MKRRILATLISTVLLLQAFCFTALADVVGTISINKATKEVTVTVSGLEAGSEFSLVGFINGEDLLTDKVDYINQYTFTPNDDGNYVVTYPSSAEAWNSGDIITVLINGENVNDTIPYAQEAKIDAPALVMVKANTLGEFKSYSPDVPEAVAKTWTSSNTSVLDIQSDGSYAALKSGVAVVKVIYQISLDEEKELDFITVKVNP